MLNNVRVLRPGGGKAVVKLLAHSVLRNTHPGYYAMTRRLGRRAVCAIVLVGSSSSASIALAQTSVIPTPPVRAQVDERGVDLSSGQVQISAVDLSIGGSTDGLKHERTWSATTTPIDGYRMFVLTDGQPAAHATVVMGSGSESFTAGPSGFTSDQGSAATLTVLNDNYTYTTADGTTMLFENSKGEDLFTEYQDSSYITALVARITNPSGVVTNINYRKDIYHQEVWYDGNGDFHQTLYYKARIQSVTNNRGYQLKYSYASDNISGGTYPWGYIVNVRAINNAVDYCAPYADSCSYSQAWPNVSYSYAATGPVNVTDPAGRVTRYNGGGIKRPLTAEPNNDVSYSISSSRVQSVQIAGAGTWSYSYTTAGNIFTTTVTDPLNHTRVVASDTATRQIVSDKDENSYITSYDHDSKGRITKVTAPRGNSTQYIYDARGNITQTIAHAVPGSGQSDISISSAFDIVCTNPKTCNQPNSTQDAKGNQTDYTYDPTHGGILTITAPAAPNGIRPQTRYGYAPYQAFYKNSAGSIVASGSSIYLPTGASTCRTTSSCSGGADEVKTSIGYGPQTVGVANNLLPVSLSTGSGDGSLTATTAFTYDNVGNVTTSDGPLPGASDVTRLRYNVASQPVGVVSPDPDGGGSLKPRAQRISYDGNGDLAQIEAGTVTDQSDAAWSGFSSLQQRTSSYDSNGRKLREVLTAGGAIYGVIEFSYDSLGRLDCTATRMNSAVWSNALAACTPATMGAFGADRIVRRSYDFASQPTKTQTAYGTADLSDEVNRTYTNNGKLATATDAENNTTQYEYDAFDRLTKTRYPDTSKGSGNSSTTDFEQLGYDAASNVISRRLRDGQTITYAYDNLNRVTSKATPGSAYLDWDLAYSYDLLGRPTSVVGDGWAGNYISYDALGRVVTEQNYNATTYHAYDLAGRQTRLTWADGFYVDYDYNVTGEVTAIRENSATSGVGVLASYAYDDLGRRISVTRGNGTTTSYGYDAVSRLSSLSQDLGGSSYDFTNGFSYNAAGQIASVTHSNDAYAWNGHYNVDRAYMPNGLNQLTTAGSTSLGYDGRGNLTSSGASNYGYTSENRMSSAPGLTMVYEPAGGQLLQYYTGAASDKRFAWSGDQMISEYDYAINGAIQRRYVPGPGTDEPIVWYEGAGTSDRRWLHADERGSVVAVTDSSGSVMSGGINRYDEYGIPASTNIGRFQYTGQAWLPELGMYYYKARIYSPTLGRFMQADPIGYGDGMNMYAYVAGDPVNNTDPTGLDDCPGCFQVTGSRPATPAFPGVTGGGAAPLQLFPNSVEDTVGIVVQGRRRAYRGSSILWATSQNKTKYPTICQRRDWHELKVATQVALLRAAGFTVALNVRIAKFPSIASNYAVADYIARAPGSTPLHSVYYLGEVKTGAGDLTPNQRMHYYSGLTEIKSSNAENIGLLKGEVIPVVWTGVDRFPGCPSQ